MYIFTYLHILYMCIYVLACVPIYNMTVAVQRMRRRMNDPHPERIDYTKYHALLCVHLPNTSSSSTFIAIKQQPSPGLAAVPLPIVIK